MIFQATQNLYQKETRESEATEEWKKAVLIQCKMILLQMASPDALIRLCCTALANEQKRLSHIYFSEQHHHSVAHFIKYYLKKGSSHTAGHNGLFIQVSHKYNYFSILIILL